MIYFEGAKGITSLRSFDNRIVSENVQHELIKIDSPTRSYFGFIQAQSITFIRDKKSVVYEFTSDNFDDKIDYIYRLNNKLHVFLIKEKDMDIKTKAKTIRSRYLVETQLFSEVFYALFDGLDQHEGLPIYILKFHSELVTPSFSDHCISLLQDYLYQPVSGMFELLDMEYNGEDLYLIYKNNSEPLVSLDLFLKQNKESHKEKSSKLLIQIARILYQLEQKNIVFGNFSLNNIFVDQNDKVILGPAMVNLICVQYFYKSLDQYDESIFLSPEFLQDFKIINSTDIYAYGILAFYLIAGQWPYRDHNSIFKIKSALSNGVRNAKDVNPKISDKLNYFIMKSIQVDESSRWDSFRSILGILEGKEVVKFEKLSNTLDGVQSFKNEIKESKQRKLGFYFSIILNVVGAIALFILVGFGYRSYFSKYSIVSIPDLVDQPLEEVKQTLDDLGLDYGAISYNFHPTINEGNLIRFDPPVGRRIKQGRTVSLFVSKGRQEILVPSFIGKTRDEVNFILQSSSIQIEEMPAEFSTNIEAGKVIAQIPLPNQYMFDSGKIQLTLSKGIPIQVTKLETIDTDFIKIKISFEFNQQFNEYQFKIVEATDSDRTVLHEGVYYPDDFYEDEFIIHQSSVLAIFVNDDEIYSNKVDEKNN